MGMRVSLAFFFSCAFEGQGEKKPKKFEQVLGRAYRKCGGSTALFFFWGSEEMEQVPGRAYRKCGGLHFSFFLGSEPEQVLRAYRKCGEWIALFFFFGCGGLNLEQVLCGGSTALFFFLGGLNLEQVPGRAYRKCGGSTALFFFLGSEPGTGARPSLQKMWRERE